jgi:plastocyanin
MRITFVRAALLAAMVGLILNALNALNALSARPAAAAETAAAAGTTVKIDNFTFTPQSLTVKAGTTVTWINEDDIPHTVVATEMAFKSKVLDTDDKYTFTFTAAGTFQYFCSLHPHMTGTIVVVPAGNGGAAP